MDLLLKKTAQKIPDELRKWILQECFIDRAVNVAAEGTPMEALFDVYEEFVDAKGEHDDWNCGKCRQFILNQFQTLKPILIELEFEQTGIRYE